MSSTTNDTTARIAREKIVAIVRLADYDHAVEVARALLAGGVSVLEFTLTGKGAIEAVTAVRAALGASVCVGVGTVLQADQVVAAVAGGAEFVVTPVLRVPVIDACANLGVPCACGALTPTEILAAHEAGAEIVKVFPATVGGPRYIRDVLAPLPFLKLLPTGGVSAENAREYLAAGAMAVGIGGNLISAKAVAAGDFAAITAEARACVQAVTP
jgi:2-dehydro-3-deoxyphosphogluconate aldolase/(4S)-4-hydroxy-2-oxoglutarate aldolase